MNELNYPIGIIALQSRLGVSFFKLGMPQLVLAPDNTVEKLVR